MSRFIQACVVLAALTISERPAHAQGDDSVLNGTIIGTAVGAGLGVAFTHAVRDSDLSFSQYSRGALIFGAMGAGAGLGIDALLSRTSGVPEVPQKRVIIAPAIWRNVGGVFVKWRW